MYIMYVDASNNTSSDTHIRLYVVCRAHPREKSKCIRTKGRLENGFVYLYYAIQFNVIMHPLHIQNMSHERNKPLLHIQFTYIFQ